MILENTLESTLKLFDELVYHKCGWHMTNLKHNPESAAYCACSFELNGYKVEHRTSKITPTKAGQFVTIWKRNKDGVTTPFDISDGIDFVIITSQDADKLGQFIFPKSVMVKEGIFSQNGIGGKRGIRVYPPWDIATNMQAEKTQLWQVEFFVTIDGDKASNLDLVTRMFG